MSHLVACPSCSRHLRVTEANCPFCNATVDADLRARPAPLAPAVRLSRAAMFAFGTGTAVVATVACSSSSSGTDEHVSVDAGYGVARSSSDTSESGHSSGAHNGSSSSHDFVVDAAYGGPPDASSSESSHVVGVDAGYGAARVGDADGG